MLQYLKKSSTLPEQTKYVPKRPRVVEKIDMSNQSKGARPTGPNVFLNKISVSSGHTNNELYTLSLKQILSNSDGCLKESYHFNFMVDFKWLIDQYPKRNDGKPTLGKITLIQGENEYARFDSSAYPDVNLIKIPLTIPFGCHHSKMSILFYDNFVKIVILTANLIPEDWNLKTQMIWISPKFEKKEKPLNSEFFSQLKTYLSAYKNRNISIDLIDKLSYYDMENVNCDLVFSVPGYHKNNDMNKYGIGRVCQLIKMTDCSAIDKTNQTLILQCSSIGTLGKEENSFIHDLSTAFLNVKKQANPNNLAFVYPCVNTVRNSFEGYMGGSCLPYNSKVNTKQLYLSKYFNDWKSDMNLRSRACPHVKTYFVYETNTMKIPWFLVTSANVSKAAWGCYQKSNTQICIRSFEIGVFFRASNFDECKYFLPDYLTSCVPDDCNIPRVLLPFDIPTTKFSSTDSPFLSDATYNESDEFGNVLVNGFVQACNK